MPVTYEQMWQNLLTIIVLGGVAIYLWNTIKADSFKEKIKDWIKKLKDEQ